MPGIGRGSLVGPQVNLRAFVVPLRDMGGMEE